MEKFRKYFSGLERNYGFCNIKNGHRDQESGKLKLDPGDYGWSGKSITDKDYEEHLTGIKSIGVQPCTDEGLARFGAIDIDPKKYDKFDVNKFLQKIQQKDLPVIPFKSKSGGLHIYVFTEDFIPASDIREFLENLLFIFGLPAKTEIFPKQIQLGKDNNDQPVNGNFINLPYYDKKERQAYLPTGDMIPFEDIMEVIECNLQTQKSLKDITKKLVNEELTGGPEEFKNGPPCLQKIIMELEETGTKLKDERDRFLFNYMVFAKKKFKDNWDSKVLETARKYFQYDSDWGDKKVEQKIKAWVKDTAGHTCNDEVIATRCNKLQCLKREFGIASQLRKSWPMLSGLEKIDYKPEPEYYVNVTKPNGKPVTIHIKNIEHLTDQIKFRNIIAKSISSLPPTLKKPDYELMIDELLSTEITVQPPKGTTPLEKLYSFIKEYLNDTRATTNTSFANGQVFVDKEIAYFKWSNFYDDICSRINWKEPEQRTGVWLRKHFNAEFNVSKRFPGKDNKTDKPFNPINCVSINMDKFKEEVLPDEIIKMTHKKDIL